MSTKQLLLCTLGFVLGLKPLSALAQSSNDPSATQTPKSLAAPATLRLKAPVSSNAVHISPTTLGPNSTSVAGGDGSLTLQGFDLRSLIARVAYVSALRIDLPPSLDLAARYDVSLTLPATVTEAAMNALILQAIEDRFHLTATRVSRPTDVYVVSALGNPPASFQAAARPQADQESVVTDSSISFRLVADPGQTPSTVQPDINDINGISIPAATLDVFCQTLEGELDRPIVNETHLQGAFNFNLKATSDTQNDLLDQLRSKMNLVIQPSNRTIEFLVFRPNGSVPAAQALFVLRPHPAGTQKALDWSSWLSASCRIEPGSIPHEICARSSLPDRTPVPSGQAPRYPASRQSTP